MKTQKQSSKKSNVKAASNSISDAMAQAKVFFRNKKSAKPAEAPALEAPKVGKMTLGEAQAADLKAEKAAVKPAAPKVEAKVEAPKAESKPAPKAKEAKTPKLTKRIVCVEMVSRKGGATIDEMAQAISDRGVDTDMRANKVTVGLWMTKLTDGAGVKIPVEKDKTTGKYTRKVVVPETKTA